MLATPDPFRLDQNPLGANHLPQAPMSVDRLRHRRGLSLAQVRWQFPRLSPIPGPSRSSSRNP